MKKAIILLAPGFEETEAVTIIDLLRRADIQVRITGLTEGAVTGSHGISIMTDAFIEDVTPTEYDLLILPGGQPGSDNLKRDPLVLEWLKGRDSENGLIAAICAAPTVLQEAGILKGKKVTSFPAEQAAFSGSTYLEDAVVRDGNIITSRGVGTAIDFSLTLVEELQGKEKADDLADRILHSRIL